MIQPKLRFPQYSDEWQEKEFGYYLEEIKEKTKEENEATLLSSAIEGMFLNSELFGHQRGSSNIGYKKIKKGMLILSAQNLHLGNANVNLRFESGMVSPAYNTYKIHNCSERFMAYWIKREATNTFFYNATTVGASVCRRNVDWKMLYASSVYFPSIEEQEKIADFFETLDQKIKTQKSIVEDWQLQKKGLMQKLFSQEVRFKATDGSDYPDWKEQRIDEFAKCFAGATPSTKVEEYWSDGTIPWMSSGEVNNKQIYSTEKKISQLGYDKCSTKMVKPNTVVMALAGQGKTRGMVAITRTELCTNQSLCAIETDDTIYDDYLYCYLGTQYDNLRKISSGDGARGGLNLQLVGGFVVPVPCLEEQHKIADYIVLLDEKIAKEQQIYEDLISLKKGLLQKMFV